jgi:predicted AlkP superfamily pyrophosphatase or phosphodiesterase
MAREGNMVASGIGPSQWRWVRGVLLQIALLAACGLVARVTPATPNRQLLIVLDGLRPDYVTPSVMPNLHALGQRGVVFLSHHSVFPTVTRVNAASISTGTYPEIHGLMGNSVFFPQVDPRRFLDTGDRANLLKIEAAVHGKLLTTPTLGEILQLSGKRVLAVSSGSTGSSYLLNYKVAGGAILQSEYALPEPLYAEMLAKFGPVPPVATPNDARNRRAVDAFLQIGLPKIDPAITLMWINDPDETAHALGVGHPVTLEALKRVDAEIKRLQDGLAAAGLLDSYDIWITSDHGFSTSTPEANIGALTRPFEGALADGTPRLVTAGGAVYVRDHDRQAITELVKALQRTDGVGAIFTPAPAPGTLEGRVLGTLSFDAIRWTHERSADILFSPDWTDARNAYGFPGTTASGGVANHGSSSPFDVHNVLIAAGPDLKERTIVRAPSGNVDFAPTFLHLIGADIPRSMEGRVLEEALRGGPNPASLNVQPGRHTVKNASGSYSLTAFFSTVTSSRGSYRYFDSTKVERLPIARNAGR